MTHLNLLDNVTILVQPSSMIYDIPNPPVCIHDVELQYANDEDVDPFQEM